ncbi:MAG: tetratricopeptide repeat protein [Prevotella sp.]|nr:tetratricopeptide repeat protein [Prevotella sp.]
METTSILNLLKQDAQIGDVINLYLTTGNSVKGTILEIGETFLLMEVKGVKRRYFPQLMGGWDVVIDNPLSGSIQKTDEQSADVVEQNDEETNEDDYNDILISLFDSIYENEHVNLSANINTNAVVDKVSPTGVSVVADSGETFVCHRGFMVGFSRANCIPGKRLFCGNVNNTGAHKGFCYLSVLQMSFEEIRERFIQALTAKTGPRKPIINSIVAYFRKNNSGKTTKKIINDLRNKVSLLGTSEKVGDTDLDKYISFKQYDKAFKLIEHEISSSKDEKQKSALLLRKAQLYSSIKDHEKAISAYRELISFNESINAPSNNLSHLYTELARLLHLIGDREQAESARNIALMLNPQNSIAKKMNVKDYSIDKSIEDISDASNQGKKEDTFSIVKFTNKSLIDDDIAHHTFIDSEIVSLNGEVSNDIVNRLIESASTSENYVIHIEAAKALKNMPVGSYDIQDLEDSITNYSIYKCRSLFNSYKKVIIESDSIKNISIEQLNKIKDCAINYHLETIEIIKDENCETATEMLLKCLLLELSSLFIVHAKSKDFIL